MTGKNTWKYIAIGALSIALVAGAIPAVLRGFLKTNHKSMNAIEEDQIESFTFDSENKNIFMSIRYK